MYKLTALFTFLILFSARSNAQNASASGAVADTSAKKGVQNAVVALLTPKDSVLYKFTRTDENGKYSFTNLQQGNYIVLTTHPYFADVIQNVEIKAAENAMPQTALTSKSKLLQEVIVKSGSPIKIKGDTTVYTADSFKVRAGANVEELLKKLPGIQVDKDGKITAMGEQVKKVLVDGEEFFGDDPGIATKNLRADVVKEVEVFDKKSDQATFTGIDDGVKDKTINLKLKDNAKKGYFGKAELASDMKNYYNNSAMINAFKGKRKLAAYGIMSNTGKTNLDWQDAQNFGGGSDNMQFTDDGGMMFFSGGGDDGDNYYGGRGGIPTNWNGGLHYSNKFNNNKQSINSGYKFSKVNSPSGQTTYTKNFIGDSSYITNSVSNGFSSKFRQSFNAVFETTIDSMNSLKLTLKGTSNNTKNSTDYSSESLTNNNEFINKSNRHTNSTQDTRGLTITGLWKHKFKKVSRTLSVNSNIIFNHTKNNSFLYTLNNYYKTGIPPSNDTTDLNNIRENNTQTYSTTATYTEPLSKTLFLSLNYTLNIANNNNDRLSFNKDINGVYSKRIDSLSNEYQYNQLTNKPGINLKWNKKKLNVGIGTSVAYNNFEQRNLTTGLNRSYNFVNFFPTANFNLKMQKNQGIRFNYNGSSNAPTLDQLQPITDNTDVLNKYVGNPDLKQSFRHNFSGGYNFYNVLKERNMWVSLWSSFTQNAFVSETTIDLDSAKTTYRTVNANGVYNINLYTQYGFKWKKTGIRFSFSPQIGMNRNITFLNTVKSGTLQSSQTSVNTNTNYTLNFNASKEKDDKYDFSINATPGYTKAKSSVNTTANASYRTIQLGADAGVSFLKHFEITSDISYQAKQKDPRFPADNDYTKWNAALKRKFFKNELEAGLSVYDILSQNRGYERTFNDYRYTETYYNTLKRYWLLNVTWNFNKNHAKPTDDF